MRIATGSYAGTSRRAAACAIVVALALQAIIVIVAACSPIPLATPTRAPAGVATAELSASPVSAGATTPGSQTRDTPTADMRWLTANGDNRGMGIATSADGRLVVFASNAPDLVPGDTNLCQSQWANTLQGQPGSCSDIFLRDSEAGTTRRISVGPDGEQANGESWRPVMTPDGRYVAFRSRADNLSLDFAEACSKREFPNWCHGIFLYDAETSKIELLFVLSDNGGEGGNYDLDISPDGRFVLFTASGEQEPLPGFRPEDPYPWPQLLWDRGTGAVRPAESGDRHAMHMDVVAGEVSANERWRVFDTWEALVPGDTRQCEDEYRRTHNCSDVYLEDMESGALRRLSIAPDGREPDGDSSDPTISSDGRYVAFGSTAHNLVPDLARECAATPDLPACRYQVYLLDLQTGMTSLVSRTPSGDPAGAASVSPRVTSDGTRIVFTSSAPDLLPGDYRPGERGGRSNNDVFVYDRETGQIEAVSIAFRPQ